jgi:hypothetical protein
LTKLLIDRWLIHKALNEHHRSIEPIDGHPCVGRLSECWCSTNRCLWIVKFLVRMFSSF